VADAMGVAMSGGINMGSQLSKLVSIQAADALVATNAFGWMTYSYYPLLIILSLFEKKYKGYPHG
jgi:hypothetical protein